MAGDGCRPRGCPDQPNQHFQGRGLPGAIGAEEAIDFAMPHAHIDAVDGEGSAAKPLAETVGLDDRCVFHGHHDDAATMGASDLVFTPITSRYPSVQTSAIIDGMVM